MALRALRDDAVRERDARDAAEAALARRSPRRVDGSTRARATRVSDDAVPYERLTPDVIIGAVESYGFETTGSILGLASYENRVYQIGIDSGFVVVKFYRPGRWSTDAILEEHDFALELAAQDIPVVPPIVHDGASLHE